MDRALFEFKEALLVRKVASRFRFAMEHATPEALKKYLQDHPDADPKNHSVKKPKGESGSSKKPDSALADAEAKRSESRAADGKKTFSEMKSLKDKVERANPAAEKKFNRAYDKLFEGGEAAAKSARKLLQKYDNIGEGFEGDDKEQREAAVEMLHRVLKEWDSNKFDHHKAKDSLAHEKMRQAERTHGYAQQLDAWVREISKTLKGDYTVDESWRDN